MVKIKINKSDFSFTEERMTLNGVTCQAVGYHGGYNTNPQRNVQSVLHQRIAATMTITAADLCGLLTSAIG